MKKNISKTKTFDYNKSKFHLCVVGKNFRRSGKPIPPTMSVFFDDLFKGTLKIEYFPEKFSQNEYEQLIKNPNQALFQVNSKKFSTKNEIFYFLFPEEIIGTYKSKSEKQESLIRAFLGGGENNVNYGPGNDIIESFEKNPQGTIDLLSARCKKIFNQKHFLYSIENVSEYFSGVLNDILYLSNLGSEKSEIKVLLGNLISEYKKQQKYEEIFSRLLLILVLSLRPIDQQREIKISEQELNQIWLSSNELNLTSLDIEYDSYEKLYTHCLIWFKNESYEKSYSLLKKIIDSKKFKSKELQQFRYLYACHLFDGKGCEKNIEEAIFHFQKCSQHSEAQFFLSCYYIGMYTANINDSPNAAKHLINAWKLGHVQATLDLAEHCIRDTQIYREFIKTKNGISNKHKQAKQLLSSIKKESCTKSQLSTFYYLTGLILEHEHSEKADACFKKAYDLGHSEAVKKIRFKKMDKHINIKKELLNSSRTKILTNSLTDKFTTNFLRTHSKVNIYTTDIRNSNNSINRVENIRAFINEAAIHNNANPSTTTDSYNVFFFADDEEKNLYDTLELLEELYNTVMEMDISLRRKIIDSFDIFLKCNYEHASMFIDATLNKMLENTYFKVHICDPDRDAAHELLYNIPLFTPLIMETNSSIESNLQKANCNVVIFSNSNFSQTLAKEIVALGYMGEKYPVTLSIIGDNATVSEEQFFCNLPGLYKCQQQLFTSTITNSKPKCIIPRFYESTLARLNLSSVISSKENPLNEIVTSGNYFIVDVGNDFQNIQFAISLRRELLKSTNDFDNAPLITIKCRDSKAAYAVDNAVLDNKPQGNEFWNKYDFRFFGMLDSLYSYENLVLNNTLEDLSCEIHCCYDEEAFNNEEKTMEVLKNYYSSQYNQDSSKITAIGLRYRLFVADLYEAPQNYEPLIFSIEKDQGLSKQYKSWLDSKDENNEYLAGSIEQTRWNGFMLSRGWEPASLNQVVGYKNQPSNGQHKHMIAKLHPFIREWEDLDEMDDNSFIVSLRNKFTQDSRTKKYKIENPKETTLKSVRDTAKMLSLEHIKEAYYKEKER